MDERYDPQRINPFAFVLDRPMYEPQRDSVIEQSIDWSLSKYLAADVSLHRQFEVRTISCSFFLDFCLEVGDKRIGIECDGKDYHDQVRDIVRDTLILGTDEIDTIFRIKGKDIVFHQDDCLYAISRYRPDLFTPRARINLERLAHPTTVSTSIDTRKPFINIQHRPTAPDPDADYEDWEEYHKEQSWSIFLEARSFRDNPYVFFAFKTFWDIIRINKWTTQATIIPEFSSIPALVDKHLSRVNSLTAEEYEMYLAQLKSIQERFAAIIKARHEPDSESQSGPGSSAKNPPAPDIPGSGQHQPRV